MASPPRHRPDALSRRHGSTADVVIAGVRLTHPDRVLYPEQEITKLDLARHYAHVAERMLPHVVGRPLTLVRCPEGWAEHCFYQKHASGTVPDALATVEIQERQKLAPYFVLRDLAGLVSLVQMGVLEIHIWGCRADRLERPDRMVFDLDPDDAVPWSSVVDAAGALRDRLDELGLVAFLKNTGGKGLHIVVPIERRYEWDEMKDVARAVAEELVREAPDRYLTSVSKAKRVGKILIDTFRNTRGATWVAPYSTRAREGAPVSMPIEWHELAERLRPNAFDVRNSKERLDRLCSDPWRDIARVRQRLPRLASRA